MNEIDLMDSRAEDVQPQGFVPSHLAEPMLRDRDAQRTQLEYVAEGLGEIRLAADLIAAPGSGKRVESRGLAETISREAARLQRLVKALAVGALALLIAGGVTLSGGGRAEAAEAPTPDPSGSVATAPVYPVMLDRVVKAAPVPVMASRRGPDGLYCVSVVRLGQPIGRSCSNVPWFTVTAWVDARVTPPGRVVAYVADDATGASVPVVLDVRRPSRFGLGRWTPTTYGDGLTVTAPLYAYTASRGAWTPQQSSPVQVQERINGRWVVRATFWTNRRGVATGSVTLGGGIHTVRVARRAGATVWSTVGTARTFYLIPTDVPVDIV